MRNKYRALALGLILWAPLALAATIETPLPNATQEQAARALFHELRCVTCEGQSVADSDATLARQMRARIRTMVAEGKSSHDILEYFQSRYGDTILMTPPVADHTALLWLAPFLLLLGGGWGLWRYTRRGANA